MRKFIFICAALALAGCADSSTGPDAARRQTSPRRLNDELTCRSGYIIAYDEFGNPYCAPVDGFAAPGDSTNTMTTTSVPPSGSPGQGQGQGQGGGRP